MLEMHPWTFAVTRVTSAAESGVTVPYNYSHQHAFPGDCLKILQVGQSRHPQEEYKIEGRKILYNGSTLYLRYIKDVEEPTQFPDLFANSLSHYRAWQMAFILVAGNTGIKMKEMLWRDFNSVLAKARHSDSSQVYETPLEDFALEEARSIGINQIRDLA